MIAPGINIIVDGGGTLTLNGSHLYTCQGMWEGIAVKQGGRLIIAGNTTHDATLIEDAKKAISFDYYNFNQVNFTGNILSVSSCIFNRNKVGILFNLNNYVGPTNTSTYPILISKTIFTCREIPFDPGLSSWPSYSNFRNTPTSLSVNYPAIPNAMFSYYINNSTYSPLSNRSYLKDGSSVLNKSEAGIKLLSNRTGLFKIGNELATTDSKNGNAVVFDNQTQGIYLTNSNALVNNCTFQNTPLANYEKETYGILGENFDESYYTLDTRSATNRPPNVFMDCRHAITTSFYNAVSLQRNVIRSSRTSALAVEGFEGIYAKISNFSILPNSPTNSLLVSNNDIINVTNGINVNFSRHPVQTQDYFLSNTVQVNDNKISSIPSWLSVVPANYFVAQAINIEASGVPTFLTTGLSVLLCNRNTINLAYNGIRFSNIQGKNMRVLNNNIALFNPYNAVSTVSGIKFEGCVTQNKFYSLAYGNDISCQPDIHTFNSSGISVNNGRFLRTQCNTTNALKMHYSFSGDVSPVNWWNNKINTNTRTGFTFSKNIALYLNSGGIIGTQSVSIPPSGVKAVDNVFGNLSIWGSANQNYKTFVSNSNPTLSKMYVQQRPNSAVNTAFDPSDFGNIIFNGTPNIPPITYSFSSGTYLNAPANANPCSTLQNLMRQVTLEESETPYFIYDNDAETDDWLAANEPPADTNNDLTNEQTTAFIDLAQGNVLQTHCTEPELRQYVAQMELYNSLQQLDSTSAANLDGHLQDFLTENQTGSFGIIQLVAQAIEHGDFANAEQMLNTWNRTNRVDDNYFQFLNWSLQYAKNEVPDINDMEHLALQCPQRDGSVVFAAQNLYNTITNEHRLFITNCDAFNNDNNIEEGRTAYNKNKLSAQNEKNLIAVYPNPATSIVNLVYNKLKQVSIIDAIGRIVLNHSFNGVNKVQLNVSHLPVGLFIIKVIGSDNQFITSEKLIIK